MNWKLIGALAVGAGLLSACSGANQTPADSADRETTTDPGGTVKDKNTVTEEKKNPPPPPPSNVVMHD